MRILFKRLLPVILFASIVNAEHFVDFEKEMHSDFVEETKQIVVPGFPMAYNPGLVPWKNGFLMSFRTGNVGSCPAVTENFEYIDYKEPYLLSCLSRNANDKTCESQAAAYEAVLICRNQIGLVLLDQHFEPIGPPQIL